MTDLHQQPYVPAKQQNTLYPVSGLWEILGSKLIGFRSSLTAIRTYLRVLVLNSSDSCPAISSELSNMRDGKTTQKEVLWLPFAPL